MRAEEIKGLIEAYSKVHETPEVLSEVPVTGNQFLDRILQGGQAFLQGRPRPTGVVNPAIQLAQQYRNAGGTGAPPTGWKPGRPVNSSRPPAAAPPNQQPSGSTLPRQEPPSGSDRGGSGTGGSGGGSGGGSRNVVSAKNIAGQQQKVTVGKQYAATLGGKKGNVTYDSSGKRTFTVDKSSTSPSTTGAQKPTTTTTPKPSGMDIWKSKYKDTLAKNVTPSGTQRGTGQSEMSRQAAELRDMQRASQLRQQGQDVMGSNITSVRQDLEKANKPENLNKAAPTDTALERQQKMTALKKPSPDLKMDLDIFDLVKGHLLDEGYVETEQNAIAMMANMSEEWRESIIMELTGGKGHPGYKAGSKDHGPMESGHPADSEKRKDKGGTMSMRHGHHLGDMDDEDEDEDDLESVVKQQSRDSRERVRKPLRDKVKAARKQITRESIEQLGELYRGRHGQSEKEYQAGRSDAGKRISGDDRDGPASYASRWHKDSKPTKPGEKPKNTQKVSKNELDNARARHKYVSGKSWNKVGGPKGLPEEVEINKKMEKWIQKVIDESSKTDDGTRARIKMFAGKKGIEFEPGPRWDPSANRGKGANLSPKQMEKQRRKKLRQEDLEAWVDELIAEGYDLSEYTWEEVAEIYAQELELSEAQRARENPEGHDKEEKRKYEPVRGERTPMPPRGDKRREDFEKWYRANVR